ncbi:hypothetical protein TSUD_118630 [Trifolium subterraneum]|uniref:Uncharacterized protein n=1 Tax=Trifolium subterraneum TaxID=3900 RepID=A0A2Z6M7L8_TRISU|nr:hypothetical protein TSUD_118630 [Trifolium subterraneum]
MIVNSTSGSVTIAIRKSMMRWVEVATSDEIAEAIDIPSPIGTALCMAAASKKDHESAGSPTYVFKINTSNWRRGESWCGYCLQQELIHLPKIHRMGGQLCIPLL